MNKCSAVRTAGCLNNFTIFGYALFFITFLLRYKINNQIKMFRLTQVVISSLRLTTTTPTRQLATAPQQKWDLYAGVLVERLPVISKALNDLEREFQELLWKVELENSLKSNHELQHEQDLKRAELIKKGKIEVELEEVAKQTAQDLKDAYTEELKKFKLAPRTTPHDKSNNTASTNRCLEDTLYLLVEHRIGNQTHFLLPQGPRMDGETLRQSAERVLREKCGDQLRVRFYGHAPCGFYKYKYPISMRGESVGAKIFFYRAALQQGNVDKALQHKFEWMPKGALEGKVQNALYTESVARFLL